MTDVMLVLLIILGAVVVIRGPKTLPRLGEAFGRGVKAARDEVKADEATGDGPDATTPPVDPAS